MLTQRTFGPVCSGTVSIDVSRMNDGDIAGLAALQKQYGIVGIKMEGAAKSVVMISAESGVPVELANIPLKQETVCLKFVGYRFSLFNHTTKSAGGSADFDYFRVLNKIDGN